MKTTAVCTLAGKQVYPARTRVFVEYVWLISSDIMVVVDYWNKGIPWFIIKH